VPEFSWIKNVAWLVILLVFTGCSLSQPVEDLFSDTVRTVDSRGNPTAAVRTQRISAINTGRAGFTGASQTGSGSFVSSRAPSVQQGQTRSGLEGFTINLVNAPIVEAAKHILSDIMGFSYIVDPRVQGSVTLQTNNPISKNDVIDIFETTLALNNAALISRGGQYQIVPLDDAISSSPAISVPSVAPKGPGVQVQVIELNHISAAEMSTILEPISRQGSILRVDSERNHLVIAGNRADLAAMRDAISVFDVDWMRGMSVALHPLSTSQPSEVANELDTIFKTKDGPGKGLVRFVPNDRLNSILAISSRPNYLRRAEVWIRKLDRVAKTNEKQLFVYQIQNRSASELADVLQSVINSENAADEQSSTIASSLAPDVQPATISTNDGITSTLSDSPVQQPAIKTINGKDVSVVADVDNNALLISTTPREYERIERILRQLDILPTQVMLEAVIAEVTLNDELEFGVRWAIEHGKFSLGLSDVISGFVGSQFPGFNFGFATQDIQVTLSALSSITDVNVISSPTLMALNNQKAVLQVGDQVPIVTQQATGVITNNAPLVNQIELRDTGIILSVVPRVNASGRVMLDIEQEVSSVVNTTTSGIDSPTIRQRKIATRVVVNDGESLALGGLIQERNELSRGQIPILGEVPVFGNLFKRKTDTINRTELLIFIKPRVVRNIQEARDVTSEFREKLSFETSITTRRGGDNRFEQDVKRLAN